MTRLSTRATLVAITAAPLFGAAGCGSGDEYANDPRPPAPIIITAVITPTSVDVSPRRFGAGPITLIIANESSQSQEVTLETDRSASGDAGLREKTSPVNPRGTTELKVDVKEGTYSLGVDSRAVRAAEVTVGPSRASASNELLQP